ncbi:MAG: D-2-hydroxyacid dehydrogenase [Dehalococcoidia bacterium]|nr:D-2-hydroxyacid dehydrogenase [Dehalococcoidia bacterium]
MPAIFVSQVFASNQRAALERLSAASARGPLTVIELPTGGEIDPKAVAGVEAAFVSVDMNNESGDIRKFLVAMQQPPALSWMHIGWAGTDSPFIQSFLSRGVGVSNSSGVTSEPIALSVIAGMLALHRGLLRWREAQARHAWEPLARDLAPPDLRGQVVAVLGLGAIGGYVATFARALGLRVIGVRRTPASLADGVDEWVPPERLREALPRTDWLVSTIPLTAATRHMVGREELALLPRGAHVINVSRGAVIDEAALIEALQSGQVAGAYLDVFETEPLPAESPLWELPNVIISPHDSWPSGGNNARAEAIFLEELEHWLQGRPVTRLVTPE